LSVAVPVDLTKNMFYKARADDKTKLAATRLPPLSWSHQRLDDETRQEEIDLNDPEITIRVVLI